MPIPLPQLDDRSYTSLLEEARSLIPTLDPEWTNHNPTDPGITLVELLAWLTEMLIYRADQITDASYDTFLRLLNAPDWKRSGDLETAIRETVRGLRERYRAVTAEDYEQLAIEQWNLSSDAKALAAAGQVQRTHAVLRRNLELSDAAARTIETPGHISLVVVPAAPADLLRPQPSTELRTQLWAWLDKRRLLGTRHHIVGPDYLPVRVTATLFSRDGAVAEQIRDLAIAALRSYFHPLSGGEEGRGWPFGRDIYRSEIYQILDQLAGVDYVEAVEIRSSVNGRELPDADGGLSGLRLQPWELIALEVEPANLQLREYREQL